MSDPYPRVEMWRLPQATLDATVEAVRMAGRRGLEAGVFWLGERAESSTTRAVVIPCAPGVEERPGKWRVSPEVFGSVSRWAQPRGLTLLGVVHTHPTGIPARLSWTDRTESIQAPGVLAVVIGNGGHENDHTEWGWYVYEQNDYREFSRVELARRVQLLPEGGLEIWRADCTHVWPAASEKADE